MGKKLMLAVALVALMAAPAFASVQNVKVGGDLKTTSVIRNNFTNAGLSVGQDSQNVILSQIGLNVQADLTDNVSTTLRLNNERIWGPETSTNTDIKLDAAYVTMKEMLYSPLTVVLGRQPLVYGNQFLIGDVNTYGAADVSTVSDLTGGVNADAIKAILTYDPLTVDLFAAKISTGTPSTTALNGDDDADLYGINANYKVGDSMNTVLEAYTFAKFDKEVATTTTKTKKLYVPGLRVSTNPIEGLNVQLEGAYQAGNDADNVTISAYGLQAGVNYALPVMKNMKPVLSAGYTYLSGDNKDTSFDSLYENQNSGRIFDVVATSTSNIKIATIAAEVTPIQDVTTKLSVYNLNLVKKGTANARVGNEVDLDVTYAYTEDVKFGLSAGVFYPGKNFAEHQKELTQVLTSVNVMF